MAEREYVVAKGLRLPTGLKRVLPGAKRRAARAGLEADRKAIESSIGWEKDPLGRNPYDRFQAHSAKRPGAGLKRLSGYTPLDDPLR